VFLDFLTDMIAAYPHPDDFGALRTPRAGVKPASAPNRHRTPGPILR
jgi:hypothetical protein